MSALWAQYGLRRNPFFQEPLAVDGDGPALAEFFSGREADRTAGLTRLIHDEQTRVLLLGAPGVGKTTLVNQLLADVRAPSGMRVAWLVAALPPLNLPRAATLQDFCIEVLRQVLDMRRQWQVEVAAGPSGTRAAVSSAAGRARGALLPTTTDIWETVDRMVHGALTIAPQAYGFGMASQLTQPAGGAPWLDLTRRAMTALVRESGRDLVVAVNNAENLQGPVVAQAASVLLDARDLFLTPHTHWLFAGTPDFFDNVVRPARQLSGTMGAPLILSPFDATGVESIIERRYAALRIQGAPFIPPITPADAGALAQVFAGDLRELLQALETTVIKLAPLGARPISLADVMQVISNEHIALLQGHLKGAAWQHLTAVVLACAPDGIVIQRFREVDAVRLLAPIRQPTVHTHKKRWIADGLIRADGRSGAAEWFTVTGAALLAMLPAATAAGLTTNDLLRGRDLEGDPLP